jgi:hypothetical protein
MAQFIELQVPGGKFAYVRCAAIERVECSGIMTREDIASPEHPLIVVVREGHGVAKIQVYGCSVLDILHGIHQDGIFLNARDSVE